MTIAHHLMPAYDLFLWPPDPKHKRDSKLWPGTWNRLTEREQMAWEKAYFDENEAFKKANLTGKDLVRWKYQRYVKNYLRCILALDESIGRLLDYLDANGLRDNTIVVYSSDQGWFLGEHGWYDKRWMYEESLRTPLMIRWPARAKAGLVCKDLVSNLDLAPTFISAARKQRPTDLQGRNLIPLLADRTPSDWRRSIYYRYYEFPGSHAVQRHYGVRTQTHKLIHFDELNAWELYDLRNDPNELHNLYDDPEHAAVQKRLKGELARLRKHYEDEQ